MNYFKQPIFKTLYAALLISASLLISSPAYAVTINVDSNCTLSKAIDTANTGLNIVGCPTGSAAGPDTIVLPSQGDIKLTSTNNTTDGNNGLPVITSEITISGNGATIRRVSLSDFRLLHVGATGDLTLNNVTLRNGFINNTSNLSKGGAIFVSSGGALTVANSVISDNTANSRGGGIYSVGAALEISNTTISANQTGNGFGFGGGIYFSAGESSPIPGATLLLSNVTISNNLADGQSSGGGLYAEVQIALIKNCTFTNNRARSGGGIILHTLTSSDVIIANNTISSNTATGQNPKGGGIRFSDPTVSLFNNTITQNRVIPTNNNSFENGAGVSYGSFSQQTVPALENNIIANNVGATNCGFGNSLLSFSNSNNNWFSDASCDGTAQGNPKLGPLAYNGGSTKTHALLAGSGAIDAGDTSTCNSGAVDNKDQRGYFRTTVVGEMCDIGAYEYIEPIVVSGNCSLSDAIITANTGQPFSGCDQGSSVNPNIIALTSNIELQSFFTAKGLNATPSIESSITIEGNGAKITHAPSIQARLFHIAPSQKLTLKNLTLSGGNANDSDPGGTDGGAIYNEGKLKLFNTTIENNQANHFGGGVYNHLFAKLYADKSTLSNNTASVGGAIFMNSGDADISNSTLSGNTAQLSGGAMFNKLLSIIKLNHATVANNQAVIIGSAFRNSGAHMEISNTIVSSNQGGASDCDNNISSVFIEKGNNWFGDSSCTGSAQGEPKLGPLQDNGGPTQTHALLADSGAIDAANSGICAAEPINNLDQRGRKRPLGSGCDIGAVEGIADESSFFVIPLPNGKAVIIVL